jgi:tetratricopeptide (TPR) repeat protein
MSRQAAGRRRGQRGTRARGVVAPPAPHPPATGWALLWALPICAGLYAYHNGLHGPFIFDDVNAIPGNPTIRRLWPILSAAQPPGTAGRPVVNLSLAINYALGGLNVWGYHAFNLGIHLLTALVLYGVVRRTLLRPDLRTRYGKDAPWLAVAVALLWVVHPLATECVTYTIQRTEVLMGLFFLLTLYCVIRGAESARAGAWYAAAVASTALGMGSKEVMAAAPLVVLAYDRLFLSKSFAEALRRRWGLYAGLAAGWLLFAALAHSRMGTDIARLHQSDVTPWNYATTQAGVILYYLRLAFWPHPLVADYDDWPLAKSVATVVPAALVVLTLVGLTLWAFLRRLPLSFLGVWFFVILAPTSSFWPLLTQFAAERRMYLPLAAVITLVVLGGHALMAKVWSRLRWPPTLERVIEVGMLVVAVATLAQVTVRRNEDYQSAVSFWSDVVAKRPNNARGHNNLGTYLERQGKIDQAVAEYSEAIRLDPNYAQAHYNLGTVLASQGKLDEAIDRYSEALRLYPNYPEAHNNLGAALATQGKFKEAAAHFAEAVRLKPNLSGARENLRNIRAGQQ